jgi:hypothetical protein
LDEIKETGVELSGKSLDKLTDIRQAVEALEKQLVGEMFESLRLSDASKANSLAEIHTSLLTLISKMESIPKVNTAENQILRLLYFSSMHSRQETITDVEEGTFAWLLEEDERSAEGATDAKSDGGSDLDRSDFPRTSEHKGTGELGNTINSEGSTGLQDYINPDTDNGTPVILASDEEESGNDSGNGSFSENHSEASAELSLNKSIVRYPEELKMQQKTRESFLNWLKSGNQVYHISGKAGSGKSTLMKFLCQHSRLSKELEAWAGDKKLAFAKFFFWNSGDEKQRSLDGLYRSLLFETLKQCPELIKEAFPGHWAKAQVNAPSWESEPLLLPELKKAMNVIVGKHKFPNHRFCFFVDGLDEFEGDSTDHWELARILRRWACSADVKICVSSRPHTEFLGVFDNSLRMHLQELTRGDIQRFTYAMFEKEPRFKGISKAFSDIVSEIVDRADGVFLWVRLVVRSLLDSIRHRSSLPTLKKKLEKIPTGLDALFDKLFNSIDPSDRERSDKMLMLAASHDALNALMYSWLEDLEIPTFPFSAPIKAYSDYEIRNRHEIVRCQLDSLSKGLLEMRKSRWSKSSDYPMASQDIYYHYEIQFFHRTVRDYLNEPVRYAEMKRRMGRFDIVEAYQCLRLAEFKFARTMKDYFMPKANSNSALLITFSELFCNSTDELPLKLMEEYKRVLDYHRQSPFSYSDETRDNPGIISWGYAAGYGKLFPKKDISYLHWVARRGQHKYVISQVLGASQLLIPHDGRSVLLAASFTQPHHNLVRDLLKHGASPNHQIMVNYSGNSKRTQSTSPMTIWIVFLTLVLGRVTGDLESEEEMIVAWFLILEEFLRSGANSNVCFLFQPNTNDDDSSRNNSEDLGFTTLEDFILKEQPPNMENLLRWTLKGKRSWLWNGTVQALSTLTPWIRGSNDIESRYKRLEIDEVLYDNKRNRYSGYKLKSICVDGDCVEADFEVHLY